MKRNETNWKYPKNRINGWINFYSWLIHEVENDVYIQYLFPLLQKNDKTFAVKSKTILNKYSTMTGNETEFKIALCQISVKDNKELNIETARKAIEEAAANEAKIVALPECWNCPYSTASFSKYAEPIPSLENDINELEHPSTLMLLEVAKKCGIYLIGGSIPEKDKTRVYNSSIVVNPSGAIIAKHRKMHLFDIDIPGKITFKESDTLSAGNSITTFDTPYCKFGIGICYDIRFPELSLLMKDEGAKFLIFPGAFNLTTGPSHWELLQRARAVDCQCYVAAVSPARGEKGYQAWGHSTIVSPWGEIVATTEHEAGIIYANVDISNVDEMRSNIPTGIQKRNDIYSLQKMTQNISKIAK